jgi:TPR repeat protein
LVLIEKARELWRLHQDQKAIDLLDIKEFSASAEALFLIGDIYNCADKRVGGVSRSVSKARKFWLESVKHGSSEAAVELGDFYYFGHGVKQNHKKAEEFWLMASESKNELGMFKLAELYYDYMPEKISQAITLYEVLSAGSTFSGNSCCKLGRIYDREIGVIRNPSMAASWYEKGSKLNNGNCLLDLSFLYYKGDGVKYDVTKAIELAEQAAKTEWLKDSAPIVVQKMRDGTLLN